MTYRRFEELPVWNDAIELAVRLLRLTANPEVRSAIGLRGQLERAVVSVSNNIAEGFERGTNEELCAYLYIARGSAGEVRSMLHLLARLTQDEPRDELADLTARCENIARQLGRWIDAIRNSGQRGPRTLTAEQRQARESTRRREAFVTELKRIQAEAGANHRLPPSDDAPTEPTS
jgi:four helix bundle protein